MLEGRHLSVAFDGRPVLDDVSLAVASGERVQLAAPSGTGKTTLCRVLAGYLAPRTGEVLVDGSPLPRRGPCPVQLIGQHPELTLDPRMRMAASLAECGASEEELGRLRELLGIRDAWLSRYPHELSGGQLQRVCIARAVACQPEIILFDEAISSLDAHTQIQIMDLLHDLKENVGLTYIFITHDLTSVTYLCDDVLFLYHGRITEHIPVSRIAETKDDYARKLLASIIEFN